MRSGSREIVEAIFRGFLVHYGAARMAANWDGLDPEEVKGYWAQKLGPLGPAAMRYALDHLPQHPPTVDEFLEAARRYRPPAPPEQLRLESPKNDESGRRRINEIAKRFGSRAHMSEC